jgi:hypothetical protein
MLKVETVSSNKLTITGDTADGVIKGMAALRQALESGDPIGNFINAEDVEIMLRAGNDLYKAVGNG